MHMAIILLYLSTASDSLIDKRNKTEYLEKLNYSGQLHFKISLKIWFSDIWLILKYQTHIAHMQYIKCTYKHINAHIKLVLYIILIINIYYKESLNYIKRW